MEDLLEALDALVDARIDYRASDSEFRSAVEVSRTSNDFADAMRRYVERSIEAALREAA